jgi:hypothetical protein
VGVEALGLSVESPRHSAPRYWYAMYGRRVRSDFHLPIPPAPEDRSEPADWSIHRAPPGHRPPAPDGPPVAELRCEHGDVVLARYTTRQGILLVNPVVGAFHLRLGTPLVLDVYPDPRMDPWTIGLVLMSQVSAVVLHQLGHFVLHASALVTEHGAIAFLGPKGRGKSTMAAYFLSRGAALLTDDALPLWEHSGAVLADPGLPLMKIGERTGQSTLGLAHHQLHRLTGTLDKKLFVLDDRFPFAREAAPLRAVYILNRLPASSSPASSPPVIEPLGQRAGVAALLAQTSLGALLAPGEAARLLAFYARLVQQAPVARLTYASGREHQPAVYDRVMAQLTSA